MLTPAKIKNYSFDATGKNAYSAKSVDAFKNEVVSSYEQMFKENAEMYKKIMLLAEKIENYKADENNVKAVLINAQRTAKQLVDDATAEAIKIKKEAADTADSVLKNATHDSVEAARKVHELKTNEEKSFEDAKNQLINYKKQLISVYKKQLNVIKSLIDTIPE